MPASPDPANDVDGLTSGSDTDDVSKAEQIAYEQNFAVIGLTVAELAARDLSARRIVVANGMIYAKDTESTEEADGVNVLLDGAGNHWILQNTARGQRGQVAAVDLTDSDPATSGYTNGATIGGVTLATDQLVLRAADLIAHPTWHGARNGVWTVAASGGAARAVAFDAMDELSGALIACSGGDSANTLWFCSANPGDTLGTDDIDFTKVTPEGPQGAQGNPGTGLVMTLLTQTTYDALSPPDDGMLYFTASGVTTATMTNIQYLTQAEYDALTPSDTTIYAITDA